MPCFLAGESQARTLGAALQIPVYPFSHQEGHVAAALYGSGHLDWFDRPFLAFHFPAVLLRAFWFARTDIEWIFKNYRISGLESRTSGGSGWKDAGIAFFPPHRNWNCWQNKVQKILGETGYERLRLQPFRSGKSLSFHVGKRGKTGGRRTILS